MFLMNLETKIGKITLRNPLILASGVLGSSYSSLNRIYNSGFGAVITKSIGIDEREGNPNPSVFFLHEIKSAINSVGLANPGYKLYREELKILIEKEVPTIVSIFGGNIDEFSEVLEGLDDLPFLCFELNLSCPNTEKEGLAVGTDPQLVYEITKEMQKRTSKPIWVKLTPNITDIFEIAEAAIKGGASALVAINTLKAMIIDIYSKKPILGFKRGGLSGAAIKPIGIRFVYDLFERFGETIPIVGVGGINSGYDVIEYLLAGASAVEVGTAIGIKYPENKTNLFIQQIKKYMHEQKVESISELIGGAHND